MLEGDPMSTVAMLGDMLFLSLIPFIIIHYGIRHLIRRKTGQEKTKATYAQTSWDWVIALGIAVVVKIGTNGSDGFFYGLLLWWCVFFFVRWDVGRREPKPSS